MAGVMDKFLNTLKFDEGDGDEFYDYEDDEVEEVRSKKPARVDEDFEEEKPKSKPARSARPTSVKSRRVNAGGMEVCVIKPTTADDSREITDTLLNNRTVVLNLEGVDVDVAQRIIDFTSGASYAIGGNLQKISHYIFIITPASVDISGDFQQILDSSFNLDGSM